MDYTVIAIGKLSGGGANGATGVNNHGKVSGWADAADGSRHAILWSIQQGLIDLGTSHPPGATLGRREANGINELARVVGFSVHDDGSSKGFRWTPQPLGQVGLYEELVNLPNQPDGIANGVNVWGPVVGNSWGNFQGDAVLWTDASTVYPLGTHGGPGNAGFVTSAAAINNFGQIAGVDLAANGEQTPFLWNPSSPNGTSGTISSLGTLPGSASGMAKAINQYGSIAGTCYKFSDGSSRAFLWTPATPNASSGSMIDLGALAGMSSSEARGLNIAGEVVGTSGGRAFLYKSGVMKDLNVAVPLNSGWILTEATDINDLGQIVGQGLHDNQPAAFFLYSRHKIPCLLRRWVESIRGERC